MRAIPSATLIGVILSAAVTGCAGVPPTQAMLTYETVPDAAEIFEGGTSLGLAPVTRTYQSDGKSNNIQTPEVKAVWPSGAKTTYFTILSVGADRVAKLERPADVPGLQGDLDHARTVDATRQREAERLRAQQQHDIAVGSARCKAEQAQGGKGLTDDCR
jgi:hypothetical protein